MCISFLFSSFAVIARLVSSTWISCYIFIMIRNRYNKIQIPHATSFAFCYCSWHCMRGYLQPGRLCMRKPWKGHRRASTQQQDHYLLLYAESNRKITAKALQNGIFMYMFPMKLLGTDSMSIAWGPDALNSSHESCWLTRGSLRYLPRICLQRLTLSQKSHTGCFRLHKVCRWRLQILYMCSL